MVVDDGYQGRCEVGLFEVVRAVFRIIDLFAVQIDGAASRRGVEFWQLFDSARSDFVRLQICLLYTSPSPRDQRGSRMPSSA